MKPATLKKFMVLMTVMIWSMPSMAAQVSMLGSTELYKDVFNIKDIDHIQLGGCGLGSDNPPIHKVKIKVHDNDIYLNRIVATFGNGQKQKFHVRKKFAKGTQSRWIDLKGNLRCIESFQLVGNTTTENFFDAILGPTATVQLWGLRKTPSVYKIKKLAQQSIKFGMMNHFKQHSKMIKSCASGKGKFRNLRIIAKKDRMKVRNFRVIFGNGQIQKLFLRTGFFYKNQISNWKDLKGNKRCIKRISYQAFSPNGAKIVVQGR